GRVYKVIWDAVPGAVHYVVWEATNEAFQNPSILSTDSLSQRFVHDITNGQPSVFFYRVQAVGTCTPNGGAFSKTIRAVVLPQKNGIINVPAGSKDPVDVQVFVPGDPSGPLNFVALLDKPWLVHVDPATGVLPVTGLTFNVTIDPAQLPNGTFTGTLTLIVSPPNARRAVNASTSKPTPITINLVTPVFPADVKGPSADTLIIPAVGHLVGVNSQWRSDVRVFNNTVQTQRYQLDFLTSEATDSKQTTITTGPGETTALDDIIHNWYGFGAVGDSAQGILAIKAVNSSPTVNPLLTIVSSRTFNLGLTEGTVGQFIPGVAFKNFIGKGTETVAASVLSLQQIAQTSSYRTNFAIIEASGAPASALFSVFNSAGTKLLDLPVGLNANEQKSLNGVLAQQGLSLTDGRVEVKVTGGDGKVTAYASVLDSNSLDPQLIPPTILGQTSSEKYVLPGVADLNNGLTVWRTDMRILNSGSSPQTANLLFYPQENSASQLSAAVTINPNEVKVLDDVLRSLFSATNTGGAVHVNTVGGSQLVVTGRTFDQTTHGSLGQFIPAATPADAISSNGRALNILQVEDSVRFRTNVGFAEMSGKAATVEVSVIIPDSKITPTIEYQLAPNEFRQVPIGVFGLGNVYNARVSVRVTNGAGSVTAYGSVIDQITTDPTFVAAQ
ncbi:MAG: hypothetical protein ACXW29_04965, partial [Thermoanaerobaculia bacterium]